MFGSEEKPSNKQVFCLLLAFFCLAYSSALKMEATCSSKTSVDFKRTTQCCIPEDRVAVGLWFYGTISSQKDIHVCVECALSCRRSRRELINRDMERVFWWLFVWTGKAIHMYRALRLVSYRKVHTAPLHKVNVRDIPIDKSNDPVNTTPRRQIFGQQSIPRERLRKHDFATILEWCFPWGPTRGYITRVCW
jgi:hypothetical protein